MAGTQGFASMDENKQKEIASKGGKASSGNASRTTNLNSNSKATGAAGKTAAAKRGGQNSHNN